MLLGQQRGEVQDNLIYGTEGFWGNLHAAYPESGASSGSFHKRDPVTSPTRPRDWVSCDLDHDISGREWTEPHKCGENVLKPSARKHAFARLGALAFSLRA